MPVIKPAYAIVLYMRYHILTFALLLTLTTFSYAQRSSADSLNMASLLGQSRALFGSDRASSLEKAQAGLEIAHKLKNRTYEAHFLNLIGIIYSYNGKFEQAREFLNSELVIGQDLGDKTLIAKAHSNIGMSYMQQGEALKSVQESLLAQRMYREMGDKEAVAGTYANIANTYIDLKMMNKAVEYADSAMLYFKQSGSKQGVANIYNTYGVIMVDREQYKKALTYYNKSLAIKKETNDVVGIANAYFNMAQNYVKLKDVAKSNLYLDSSGAMYQKNNDVKGLAKVLALQKSNQVLQSTDTAKFVITRDSRKYLQNVVDGQERLQAALGAAEDNVHKKNYKTAVEYYKLYWQVNDSLETEKTERLVADMDAKYQAERKQAQISILSKKALEQQIVITRRNWIIASISALLVFITILGFLFYNRYRLKQEAKLQAEVMRQQDIATQGIIAAEERERKRIAADLHDGVGQLFSTVRLNLGSLLDRVSFTKPDDEILAEKTVAMVDESCREVRTIAHQMMPNVLLKTGLASAVKDFISKIDAEKLKVTLETSGLNERLDSNTEIVLYRVIQECVNNVIKHAGASRLDIQLDRDATEISVTVEDNGKGFDTTDKEKFEGIGLKNILTRLAYLKGTADFSSSPGKGTLVAIYVPLS